MYMMMISTFILLIMMVMTLLLLLTYKKLKLSQQKNESFSCGFNSMMKHLPMISMRFFMITILFIIFDVEIALILPMIPTFKLVSMYSWTLTSLSLTMILLLGTFHEWKYNIFEWS